MLDLLRGVPARVWGLLALIVLVPLLAAVLAAWSPASRRLGLATRLTSWAVALMGFGFGAMALVATLAVLQTGLQEIRQRHLASVVDLAADLSGGHARAPDSTSFARNLSLFRALEPEAGPAAVWGLQCGDACLSITADPAETDAAEAWARHLIERPPARPGLRTATFRGEMHLVLAGVLRDPAGVPEGYLAVALRAGWVAERALRTALVMVGIAYASLLLVGWLTRSMLVTTVAARVHDIVGHLRSTGDAALPAKTPSDRADELAVLETAVNRHIVQSVERLRVADQRTTEARELAARMEATATLAAGVAHDFSNLMSGVMANCELLREDVAPDPAARRTLETIFECAQRGGLLAQQLVAFARGGKYQPAVIDLNDLVEETLRVEAHTLDAGIVVEPELARGLPLVEADPVQLSQVASNLHRNAVDAIRAHGGTGTIRFETAAVTLGDRREAPLRDLPAGPYVVLTVRDTGPGMSEETRARIFEPFFTTKQSGRGMGLAATYGIVTNHGGVIVVTSEEGRGSTFAVYLPVAAGPFRPSPQPGVVPPLARPSTTVLLVDDEVAILSATRRLLERRGYHVLTAESGGEAVHIAQNSAGPIHVVLLDLRMPGMSGVEAFAPLVAARPDTKIVLSSGYELDDQARALLDRGAVAFVRKPFGVEELTQVIDRFAPVG